MLQTILEFLFGSPFGQTINALGPLALAGIGAGINAIGGLLSGKANKRVRTPVPDELTDLIGDLSNPNFFLSQLQRTVNNDQGFFNIEAGLAARGIDSPAILREQQEALESSRQDAIVQGLDQLEGLRLQGLQRSLGLLSNINAQNARSKQNFINNRLGILNSTISGIGGSVIQGLGAKIQQENLNRILGSQNFGGGGNFGFDIGGNFELPGLGNVNPENFT